MSCPFMLYVELVSPPPSILFKEKKKKRIYLGTETNFCGQSFLNDPSCGLSPLSETTQRVPCGNEDQTPFWRPFY